LYRIFGVAPEDFDGSYESFLGVVHPDDREGVTRAVQKALDERQHYSAEYRVVRPDGTELVAQARGKATYDEAGQPVQLMGTVQDITERRALEEQLRQAQKLEAVARLAGGVAHDFNNLLTVVLGESELALQDLPPDHALRDPLQEIHDAGERGKGLTGQLLAFSRKQVVEPVVLNLNELTIGVDKMLRRLIGEDVELITRTASDPVVVIADRGQIEQVLVNLAVNARDAMPQGGQLVIEVSDVTLGEEYARSHADAVAGDYALISVSDTGTGMTAEVKARLFEPFFTTKDRDRGTGLGLAVCYGIAKQFGGHIGVYSELGFGTTVKVYLPRAAEPAEAPVETVAASPPRGSETILLVEDEKPVRKMAMRILRAQGYRVLEAGDGEQALQLFDGAEGRVQLLLCDVVLPNMGGRAVAERVRELHPDIKVLFVSGYTDDVILKNQLLEGDVTLLQKPFTPSTLAFKVREVLDGASRGIPGG
jgi:PAS domain S-box-containing protein